MIEVPRPFHQHGFWWWYDPERKDWFIGCAPAIGYPQWWKPDQWRIKFEPDKEYKK